MNTLIKQIKNPKDILFEEIVDIVQSRKTFYEMGLTETQTDNYMRALKKGWDLRDKVVDKLSASIDDILEENLYLIKKLNSLGVSYDNGKTGRQAGDLTH